MASNHHRSLKFRVQEYLPALKAREITNREVAAHLGCNEQALSRMLGRIKFQKDAPVDRKALTELNRVRKAFRTEVANRPGISLEEAAKICDVSVRTIYRYKKQ